MKIRNIFLIFGLFVVAKIDCTTLWQKCPIDFYTALSHSPKFNRRVSQTHRDWNYLKKLYDKGMNHHFTTNGKPAIPDTFHLIWLGSKPPKRYDNITRQLKKLHPGCKVKLWTDTEAKKYQMINRKAFEAAANYGEKSDIWRYEILYNEGGVYFDGDFDVLKSFKDLLYACNFFAGIAYDDRVHLYNGLIGCEPKHPIMKLCISDLGTKGPKNDPNAIMERSGPYHFTRCFFKGSQSSKGIIIPFPYTYFYPWPNYDRFNSSSARIKQWLKPYSLAVHLWACSWVGK